MTNYPMAKKEFDLVVYGASGFTGRLVAEYLTQRGIKGWAMAGRNTAKLAEVRDLIGAPKDTPLIEADASNPASLKAMCERTRCVLTTVGPYQLYGSELVAECAASGTDLRLVFRFPGTPGRRLLAALREYCTAAVG